MSKNKQFKAAERAWVRPEVKKLDAGAAEANQPTGIDDGGPVGNARS